MNLISFLVPFLLNSSGGSASSSSTADTSTCNNNISNMPSYELIYFDGPGRAEAIRICLHAAGVEFVDTRIKFSEWGELKPKTPLGSLPVLKIDSVEHCQSVALLRYAGKLAGWYPTDNTEALVVDEALDSLNELMSAAPQDKDDAVKKQKREEYQANEMTKYAAFLENLIQKNGGSGFTSTPSIADLTMQGQVQSVESGMWDYIDSKFFEAYPGIMATSKAVTENPQVQAYYASIEK